jgi:uncharacterized RDD family membrane protein YckC
MTVAARRLAAYLIDLLPLAVYAAALFLVVAPHLGTLFTRSAWFSDALSFVLIVLPLLLYFIVAEARGARATFGKKLLGLRVELPRSRPAVVSSSIRAILQLAPWELAHFGIWHAVLFPHDVARSVGTAFLLLANVLAVVYAGSLFIGDGRTPYDRLAGTRVVRA